MLRLTDAEALHLASLAGHVVELELGLSIDIDQQGASQVLYQHDLMILVRPFSRMPREVWFQYIDSPITIRLTKNNDRSIVIQRIHDAGSLAKFAFKISPALLPGERTTVHYRSIRRLAGGMPTTGRRPHHADLAIWACVS